MANSLLYRSALNNLLPIVAKNFPFIRNAMRQTGSDSLVPAYKGKTVSLARPNPHQFAAAAITPAAYGSGEQAVKPIEEQITLDQWYGVNFLLTDLEWNQLAWEGIVSPNVRMAAMAIGENIESALVAKALVGGYQQITKTADALYDLAAIGDKFNDNGVGNLPWTLAVPSILAFTSNANLLSRDVGGGAGNVGGYAMQTALGRVEHSHALSGVSFTDGTSDSLYQCNAAGAIGDTSMVLDSEGSGTMKVGDIVTFAGHTGNYVVTQAITAAGDTLKFYPGLRAAVAENEVIALTATTAASLGIAIAENVGVAFVSRPEEIDAEAKQYTTFESVTDPNTGISLAYEVSREHKQTRKILSVLYGCGQAFGEGLVKYKIS